MDRVEDELSDKGIYDVNATQALMLKNIGGDKSYVQKTTTKGYYLGTNLSYNIAAMLKKGYLTKQIGYNDKRRVYLMLTDKGIEVLYIVNKALSVQQESLTKTGIEGNYIKDINKIVDKLQRVLDSNIRI